MTPDKKKRIALYCRVSTRDQNPENQRIQLEEYAKRMNYNYKIFEEIESTRKTRPVKQDLMNRLRRKEFDGMLVLKLDRFARSLSELVMDVKELIDKGIAFISLRDNLDLSSATGKLQFHILAAFAEFEREIIRERTLDGLAVAKANGSRLGRPKGRKDSGKRRKSGYFLRYSGGKK